MRFCDKLPKQRKNNNLSQEQLADRLGVSRQAVSKWESGASYPDMDKILQICKVLDCKLEDLLDDGTVGTSKKESKVNLSNPINDFLSFITKVYNMFCSMTFNEKIKCLCEMFFVFILLLISGAIVCSVVNNLIFNFFLRIPIMGNLIYRIFESLLVIALIIVGFIILIHILKIRYLDYFITIEDKEAKEKTVENELPEEKVVGNKKYIVEKEKTKVIIRDPKHSTLSFIHILGKLCMVIIKIFTCVIACPILCIFASSVFFIALSLCHIGYGIMFLWMTIAAVGVALLAYVILAFLYDFIFNRKIKFKLYFTLAMSGIAVATIATGLSAIAFMNYDHVNPLDGKSKTSVEYLDMKDNMGIYSYYDNLDYEIDNSLTNIKVEVTYPEGSNYRIEEFKTEEYDNYHIYIDEYDNIFKAYKMIKKDLKKGIIRDYNCADNLKIKITLSQENYDKLESIEE